MLATYVRDPFARMDYVREVADKWTHLECAWCGAIQQRRAHLVTVGDTRRTVRSLYHYGTHPDGGRLSVDRSRAFCSVSCMRGYTS